jgi:hypothetical protein
MTDEQLRDLKKTINKAIDLYKGDVTQLEAAIGLAFLCEHMGWKPMMLVHDPRTIKKYDEIMRRGNDAFSYRVEKLAPEIGPKARKLVAWDLVQKGRDFWRSVRGQEKGVRQPTAKLARA